MSLPTELSFNGQTIALKTFAQLEQQSRTNLKLVVKTLQEQLGDQGLPPLTGHSPDLTIAWILDVQCAVCMGKGLRLTPADFGAPAAANEDGFFGRGEAMPSKAAAAPMYENSENSGNAGNAYEDATRAAQAARQRNMGSNIFG